MQIAEISAHIVRLRLRKEFKHASFSRNWSDNLLVQCRLRDGTTGWGEGVPREYVTGETTDGALAQLAATDLADQLAADCGGWDDVIRLCEQYRPNVAADDPRGCLANAHRCAVELSILDAYGQLFGSPLSELASHYPIAEGVRTRADRVQYSSAISSGGFRKELLSSLAMRAYGFRQCKVKVGMQPDRDASRLKRMRRWVGPHMDLRVDANEAWTVDEVTRRIRDLEPFAISCVEQPVKHEDVDALSDVRREVTAPIMLDESLTSEHDAEVAIRGGTCDLFNVRLSKCGGFLARPAACRDGASGGLGLSTRLPPRRVSDTLGRRASLCHVGRFGPLSRGIIRSPSIERLDYQRTDDVWSWRLGQRDRPTRSGNHDRQR